MTLAYFYRLRLGQGRDVVAGSKILAERKK